MKSFSRIHSPVSSTHLEPWSVSDLDVEANVYPPDVETDQIMFLFSAGKETKPGQSSTDAHLTFHRNGVDGELTTWLPIDLDHLNEEEAAPEWEFAEPSNDFHKIPEQQILQEKLEAEKERVELIKRARVEAEEILHAARLEADKILLRAQDEIEQVKKEAHEAAYKEMQTALGATHAIVEEAHKWQSSFMEIGEQVLADMLKDIAQTMFGEGVKLDADALQVNLNRIMESAQRLGDLKIFLNPQDANLLDPSWSDYQLLITGNRVRVVPSDKILPGGCFIKGNTGAVDARVETQLAAVLNAIEEVSGMGR